MRKIFIVAASMAVFLTLLSGCNRLSKEAKQMTGNYFIPVVSKVDPPMELLKNGKCTIRKVVPGVVTFAVDGRWNVKNDSLIAELKPSTLTCEGDSSLIGDVPERVAFKITEFNDVSLTIEQGGVNYTYHRRPEN